MGRMQARDKNLLIRKTKEGKAAMIKKTNKHTKGNEVTWVVKQL